MIEVRTIWLNGFNNLRTLFKLFLLALILDLGINFSNAGWFWYILSSKFTLLFVILYLIVDIYISYKEMKMLHYDIDVNKISIMEGYITRRFKIIPRKSIQKIYVERDGIERLIDLASVIVSTPQGITYLYGLSPTTAYRIAKKLRGEKSTQKIIKAKKATQNWSPPRRSILYYWSKQALFCTIILLFYQFGVILIWGIHVNGIAVYRNFVISISILGLVLFGIALIFFYIYSKSLVENLRYKFTNDKIITESGVVSKLESELPFTKVTDFSVQQLIRERILGLSTIVMNAKGEETFFLHLDKNSTKQVTEYLIKKLRLSLPITVRRVSPKVIVSIFLGKTFFWIFYGLLWFLIGWRSKSALIFLGVIFGLLISIYTILEILQYCNIRYGLTTSTYFQTGGALRLYTRYILRRKLQNTTISQSWYQKGFNIATLTVQTRGGAAVLEGIPEEKAKALRRRLQ